MMIIWILRQIFSFVQNLIFIPYWFLRVRFDPKVRKSYEINRLSYNVVKDLTGLVNWFRTVYKYQMEALGGIMDHDASEWEFFGTFGACEDAALYAKKKMIEIGYKKVSRVAICSKWLPWLAMHMDTFFRDDNGKFHLFNYGDIVDGDSLYDCFENLAKRPEWENYKFNDKVIPSLWSGGDIFVYPF